MTPPAGTTGARAVGLPGPDAGSGPARTALLLLAAVPVAVVALVLWELGVQTSAGYNPSERVRGWSAVLRELPALVLLFAPVVLGLGLGVRAARLGARPGRAAIWLHAGALLFLLAIALAGAAEDVMTTDATVTTRL
ncbi:MAG TPA: hypothetical protein VFO65_05400, partial [Acidimicrobiales bacterium]|nr:hypothetical protein [Acidimicrobiales bacterium]